MSYCVVAFSTVVSGTNINIINAAAGYMTADGYLRKIITAGTVTPISLPQWRSYTTLGKSVTNEFVINANTPFIDLFLAPSPTQTVFTISLISTAGSLLPYESTAGCFELPFTSQNYTIDLVDSALQVTYTSPTMFTQGYIRLGCSNFNQVVYAVSTGDAPVMQAISAFSTTIPPPGPQISPLPIPPVPNPPPPQKHALTKSQKDTVIGLGVAGLALLVASIVILSYLYIKNMSP